MGLINPKDRIYKKPRKPSYMISLARQFRRNPTHAEKVLWNALREKNFFGHHLRRQAPFGRYVFDVYCAKKRIAFEIDGDSHDTKAIYDKNRDMDAGGYSVKVIRLCNDKILENIEDVLDSIENALNG